LDVFWIASGSWGGGGGGQRNTRVYEFCLSDLTKRKGWGGEEITKEKVRGLLGSSSYSKKQEVEKHEIENWKKRVTDSKKNRCRRKKKWSKKAGVKRGRKGCFTQDREGENQKSQQNDWSLAKES